MVFTVPCSPYEPNVMMVNEKSALGFTAPTIILPPPRTVEEDEDQYQGVQGVPAPPTPVPQEESPTGVRRQRDHNSDNTMPPPSYEVSTTPRSLPTNFKQKLSASDTSTLFPNTPLWARLLGIALAKEWLHSSGILSTFTTSINSDLSFAALDGQIQSKFEQGSHGSPWKRLRWVYLLKGRWLGMEQEKEIYVLTEESWEEGRRLMLGMMDVELDLAFCFQSGYLPGDEKLPGYEDLVTDLDGNVAGDAPGRESHRAEATKTAEIVVAEHRMRPGSRPHSLRKLLGVRRAQRRPVYCRLQNGCRAPSSNYSPA